MSKLQFRINDLENSYKQPLKKNKGRHFPLINELENNY